MVHYLKNPKGGRPIAVDYRTGKIKEEHESWYDPQKPPETEPPEKWMPPIPGYEHPPKYLVPKGNGFYGDPNEPADPQDCDGPLGEISPWCGGNPFSIKPFDLDPEVKWDECNIWARINPVVGFVKIRPITLSYRLPGECRNEPPVPPVVTPKPGKVTVNYPKNIDPDLIVYAFVSHSWSQPNFSGTANWNNYRCPGDKEERNGVTYNPPVTGFYTGANGLKGAAGILSPNQGYGAYRGVYYALGMTSDGRIAYRDTYSGLSFSRQTFIENATVKAKIGQFILTWTQQVNVGYGSAYIYEGRYGSIIDYLHAWIVRNDSTLTINVDFVVRQTCSTPFEKDKIPPPPEKPPKDCCMDCTQQNELLRQILAEVKKGNERVGVTEFPASIPKGLSRTNDSQITIQNIPQFIGQLVIYIDEIIGEVPVKIKIQDSDLLKEGDQPVELVFENVLEMQAEQFGVTMNNSINTELLVQLITKTLIELAVLRKQLHTLQSSHNAMTQYFGYDVKESFEEVAFTVTVPKADKMNEFSMDQFVKESTQKVEVSRIEKKEIGAHRKYMLILQKMAGIITAVFWRKLVKGGVDLADQMKSLFNKQHQTINDIDKHQDDFEDWLEEYERGFTTTEGYQGDPAKPWGDDYEARPRTKIVGKLDADVQPPTES